MRISDWSSDVCSSDLKPTGHTCSTKDRGRLVYDLLPPRFAHRSPQLSTVGRLDRDTSGLLLMTDDGALLHRIISPKSKLTKVYEATLAQPLRGDERSEERRVGKECVSTFRFGWSPDH